MLADQPTDPTAGRLKSPNAVDGTAVIIHLYIEDVDSVMEKATEAGQSRLDRWQTNFTEIVPAYSPTLSAMFGTWPPMLKIYRQKKWRNGWRNCQSDPDRSRSRIGLV